MKGRVHGTSTHSSHPASPLMRRPLRQAADRPAAFLQTNRSSHTLRCFAYGARAAALARPASGQAVLQSLLRYFDEPSTTGIRKRCRKRLPPQTCPTSTDGSIGPKNKVLRHACLESLSGRWRAQGECSTFRKLIRAEVSVFSRGPADGVEGISVGFVQICANPTESPRVQGLGRQAASETGNFGIREYADESDFP